MLVSHGIGHLGGGDRLNLVVTLVQTVLLQNQRGIVRKLGTGVAGDCLALELLNGSNAGILADNDVAHVVPLAREHNADVARVAALGELTSAGRCTVSDVNIGNAHAQIALKQHLVVLNGAGGRLGIAGRSAELFIEGLAERGSGHIEVTASCAGANRNIVKAGRGLAGLFGLLGIVRSLLLLTAGNESKNHRKGQNQCKCSFHFGFIPSFLIYSHPDFTETQIHVYCAV